MGEEVLDEIEEVDSDEDDEEEEEPTPEYIYARELFITPEVEHDVTVLDQQLKWKEPDQAGLIAFLVDKLGFNQARVESGIKKLKDAKGKSSQKRMDTFFKVSGVSTSSKKKEEPKGKGKGAAGKKKQEPCLIVKNKDLV